MTTTRLLPDTYPTAPPAAPRRWTPHRVLISLVVVILGVMFTGVAVQSFTLAGQPPTAQSAYFCAGGAEFYGHTATASQLSVMGMGTNQRSWKGDTGITQERTPLEWYGTYIPFTSAYPGSSDGNIKEACGVIEGPLSTWVPSMIFMMASVITLIIISVYEWATNPLTLQSLFQPIDCLVAGSDSVSPSAYSGAALCPAGSPGLRETLFLQWLLVPIFFGALWAAWVGIVRRRTTQTLIGAGWMILAASLSMVFLIQPMWVAQQTNNWVSSANAVLMNSMNSLPGSSNTRNADMCYLSPRPTGLEASQVPFRRAGCTIWKNFIFYPWAYGQFGSLDAAAVPIEDRGYAGGIAARFPQLQDLGSGSSTSPDRMSDSIDNVAFLQIDATILDREELLEMRDGGGGGDPCGDQVAGLDCEDKSMVDEHYERFDVLYEQINTQPVFASSGEMWAGRAISNRYSASVTALVGAVVGGIVIFILGFLNIIYQIGMILLIAIAPLMLLVGIHPGYGRRVALRWLEALMSTFVKRIVLAFLLTLVVTVFGLIAQMDIGWFTRTLIISTVGIAILMYRKQLTQILTAIDFGGGGQGMGDGGASQKAKQQAQNVVGGGGAGMVAAAAAGGGVGAVIAGGVRGGSMGRSGVMGAVRRGSSAGRASAARSNRGSSRSGGTSTGSSGGTGGGSGSGSSSGSGGGSSSGSSGGTGGGSGSGSNSGSGSTPQPTPTSNTETAPSSEEPTGNSAPTADTEARRQQRQENQAREDARRHFNSGGMPPEDEQRIEELKKDPVYAKAYSEEFGRQWQGNQGLPTQPPQATAAPPPNMSPAPSAPPPTGPPVSVAPPPNVAAPTAAPPSGPRPGPAQGGTSATSQQLPPPKVGPTVTPPGVGGETQVLPVAPQPDTPRGPNPQVSPRPEGTSPPSQ